VTHPPRIEEDDDLLSEWLLMVYGYTYPHWNAKLEQQAEWRAWLDGIIAERFRDIDGGPIQ
jgi:hypothetical protein